MSWHNFKRKLTYYLSVSPMGMAFISGGEFAVAVALLAQQQVAGLLFLVFGVLFWVLADKTDTNFVSLVRDFIREQEKGEE